MFSSHKKFSNLNLYFCGHKIYRVRMKKIELEIVALSHSITQTHSYAVVLGEVNGLVNLIQAQNSLTHFEIYKCPIGFEQIILALKKHLDYLKFIRLVDVKIVNYEILNILNDGSRWEIMDLSISHTHGTD